MRATEVRLNLHLLLSDPDPCALVTRSLAPCWPMPLSRDPVLPRKLSSVVVYIIKYSTVLSALEGVQLVHFVITTQQQQPLAVQFH
jgi:hypothetical protein